MKIEQKDIDRFMRYVEKEPNDGCWNWTGHTHLPGRQGYGKFFTGRKQVRAHRFSYEAFVGPIPDGLHVLHRCDNKLCVNPTHLHVGTHSENMCEAHQRKRIHRHVYRINTDEQSLQVIDLLLTTDLTGIDIARQVGVSGQHVSNVKRGVAGLHLRHDVSRPVARPIRNREAM